MRRDLDLVRDLLLAIEDRDEGMGDLIDVEDVCEDEQFLYGHLKLMLEKGLIEGADRNFIGAQTIHPTKLTWEGHDFLDSVRDPEIWNKTKHGMKAAGGFTFELARDLAKGFIRTQIKKHTDIEI